MGSRCGGGDGERGDEDLEALMLLALTVGRSGNGALDGYGRVMEGGGPGCAKVAVVEPLGSELSIHPGLLHSNNLWGR